MNLLVISNEKKNNTKGVNPLPFLLNVLYLEESAFADGKKTGDMVK